ncbi:MAG: glycerol-3-phosphate dehydrogenase/oxidase [Limnohabitans sp.]|nr:glycerol-3-phosphate dehydrogenase/oxidase [Limnohabitans sp.]
MQRLLLLQQLSTNPNFDVAIIGGGATGLGAAVEAALKGYRVVLLEAQDFAKGTSSRSTKLLHGGVRYLAQGNIALIYQALHERGVLLNNASHLAHPLSFIVPTYSWWDTMLYTVGLKIYDALAGASSLGPTHHLSSKLIKSRYTHLMAYGLKGGVQYWDAQFDDSRLAISLARTAQSLGARVINYCPVQSLNHQDGLVKGLNFQDALTQSNYTINAACVINATGVWVDDIRNMSPHSKNSSLVSASQGVHVVVDHLFWPYDEALLIPKTSDGRVLFVVPWMGHVILGTTDTPQSDLLLEPKPTLEDVQFILQQVAPYLNKAPRIQDIKSMWAGLRPLVQANSHQKTGATSQISREYFIGVDSSRLVTITGGKWTTYRVMAEDVIDRCIQEGFLPKPPQNKSTTHLHPIKGLSSDAPTPDRVRYAVQNEMALSVEDVLARRSLVLFLEAGLAIQLAPQVAQIMASEGIADPRLDEFVALAKKYMAEYLAG